MIQVDHSPRVALKCVGLKTALAPNKCTGNSVGRCLRCLCVILDGLRHDLPADAFHPPRVRDAALDYTLEIIAVRLPAHRVEDGNG